MPDILVVDSNMSMDSYIAKGLVANVDDLIAGDEELSKNDYLQNVWDAYRVDGKLYYVIPSFYISTCLLYTSNKSRGEVAYTMLDIENAATQDLVESLQKIDGVFRVRIVK